MLSFQRAVAAGSVRPALWLKSNPTLTNTACPCSMPPRLPPAAGHGAADHPPAAAAGGLPAPGGRLPGGPVRGRHQRVPQVKAGMSRGRATVVAIVSCGRQRRRQRRRVQRRIGSSRGPPSQERGA